MITISGWAYEASIHCNDCATERFGQDLWRGGLPSWHIDYVKAVYDFEGNEVRPFFRHEESHGCACDDCFEPCI